MSENNTNPKIEDEILTHLESDFKESALEFISYLNKNQMTPRQWFGPGFWIISYGENNLFGIHLYGFNSRNDSNGWVFWFFSGDYSGAADEELIKFVQDNAGHCVKCSGECTSQGVDMTIFSKKYTNMCYQFPVRIEDPDNETLEKIKKLIGFWKEIAPRSNGLHVR
jgi:hypothetical protein